MSENLLDQIIGRFENPAEQKRIDCIVIYDYYIQCYKDCVGSRFPGQNPIDNSDKMMAIFFLICLNSVEPRRYGLFEIFENFKISTNWANELLKMGQSEVDYLSPNMPRFKINGRGWKERTNVNAGRWKELEDAPLSSFIYSSHLSDYAKMVDQGIKQIVDVLPEVCLRGLKASQVKDEWSMLKQSFAKFELILHSDHKKPRGCNIKANFGKFTLNNDKDRMHRIICSLSS